MLVSFLTKTFKLLGLAAWVVIGVVLGQTVAGVIILTSFQTLDATVGSALTAALGYLLAIILIVLVPLKITKKKLNLKLLGFDRLPSWSDIGLGALALLPYILIASVVLWVGTDVLRFIDIEVGQQISFTDLYARYEYVVAFLTLVVLAPVAEELLFRGYMQGTATKVAGKIFGVLVVAVIFGLMHLPGITENGIVWQWGVAVDTFSLGIVAGVLRLIAGSIWPAVVLHAVKNGIAYYFLFVAL